MTIFNRRNLIFLLLTFFIILFPSTLITPVQATINPEQMGATNVRDYGAKGDGITDDSQAIQRAIEDGNRFIYFPNGTYLICTTLQTAQTQKRYTFQGESRDQTIIKVKDSCPPFEDSQYPRPVLSTEGTPGQAFRNSIYDLTLDIGQDNPGAIGIQYLTNNQGVIENVTIRSSDPNQQGYIGLDLTLPWPGPGLIKNVSIIGFDYGIVTDFAEFGMVFEEINLEKQRVLGIKNKANLLSIRKLISHNSVPAIENIDDRGMIVILDSELMDGNSSNFAIDNQKGFLYIRNLKTSGYQSAIKNKKEIIPETTITEYVSHEIYSVFPSPRTSLNLPIEDTPNLFLNQDKDWVSVTDYGADETDKEDDTPAIQKALNSGNSMIYFPKGKYFISQTLTVSGKVKKITGLDSTFAILSPLKDQNLPVFRFEEGESDTIILEKFWGDYGGGNFYWVEQASPKTLVLKNFAVGSGSAYRNSQPGRLFIEDVTVSDWIFDHQTVWARQLNPEGDITKIVNKGGTLWILGLKIEDEGTIIKTLEGGKTEVLGGLIYPGSGDIPSEKPAFINDESDFSMVMGESYYGGAKFNTFVQETRNGVTKNLLAKQLPRRGRARAIPLYVGYEGNNNTNLSEPQAQKKNWGHECIFFKLLGLKE